MPSSLVIPYRSVLNLGAIQAVSPETDTRAAVPCVSAMEEIVAVGGANALFGATAARVVNVGATRSAAATPMVRNSAKRLGIE